MTHQILTATLAHVQELGKNMNAEDVAELKALGMKPHKALWRSWRMSMVRRALIVDGEVAAIWGVVGGILGTTGTAWLLTGPKLRQMPSITVARIYRAEVEDLLETYQVIENLVDCSYIGAVRMLKIAGFSFDEPVPIGKFKSSFMRFYKAA